MEWLDSQEKQLRQALNSWFSAPDRDQVVVGKSNLWRPPVKQLDYLTKLFLDFSSNEFHAKLSSEELLLKKIFTTSRHQIRSFIYVSTLKKFRRSISKINNLKIPETFSSAALSACTNEKLMSLQTLHSYEWRLIALYQLLLDVERNGANLVELITEEMTASLFLHYPIAYTSMCSSIAVICKNYRESCFDLLCKFRTMEKASFLPFPSIDTAYEPPAVPWNDCMNVKLEVDAVSKEEIKQNVQKQQATIKKLDIKVNVKATGAPIKAKVNAKPKKSGIFGSLGF